MGDSKDQQSDDVVDLSKLRVWCEDVSVARCQRKQGAKRVSSHGTAFLTPFPNFCLVLLEQSRPFERVRFVFGPARFACIGWVLLQVEQDFGVWRMLAGAIRALPRLLAIMFIRICLFRQRLGAAVFNLVACAALRWSLR